MRQARRYAISMPSAMSGLNTKDGLQHSAKDAIDPRRLRRPIARDQPEHAGDTDAIDALTLEAEFCELEGPGGQGCRRHPASPGPYRSPIPPLAG
jgi:hypothetical protein